MAHGRTACSIQATDFDAVIFDLDGVVTNTASVHAAAWKRMFDGFLEGRAAREGVSFRPFDIETDYLAYVDGKPRLDGLRSFLESRGIHLPEGTPDAPPGEETLHGLGKSKNAYFLERIQEEGAKVYASTVDLIHGAKKHGLKTAVISSSRSCAMILDSVNLSDLFDVRVDGVDLELLGITGKPAPDIFLEAARQLRVEPERTVVIEDAISGVQAGRAGNFGRVIGIARTGRKEALLENGAHWVVEDLSEVCVAGDAETAEPLPSALDELEALSRRAGGKRIAVFLDYDGTLTPIVETPDQAVMAEDMREAVMELSSHCPVGIISGRDLEDVQDKVGIRSIVYAGSHGFDITGPKGLQVEHTVGEEFLPALDRAEQSLFRSLGSIEGLIVERKKFAIAIHYRRVDPAGVERVEAVVDEVAASHPELRKSYGKKIFELQPRMDWHKGKALLSLLGALKLDRPDVLPFYIGDDVTDEDAFRALEGRGIGIVVRDLPYETAAAYSLRDPGEVRGFLLQLIPLCGRTS
ncbi:MAG: trehalose-phosphatase [Syntrophobacteraceae bacterium]|nr:trehalose-phosphatase [Syntrophobacteraceae bacterium]